MAVGLYIHVPFCLSRCDFCAFYLQVYRGDRAFTYLQALNREIKLHGSLGTLAGQPLTSVYFGGGTPTTLRPRELAGILETVRRTFGITPGAEVTVEAHPDTVTRDGVRVLADAGLTRLSVGVQSLATEELTQLGRHTDGEAVRRAVQNARRAGIRNINLDLMYGLPGQSPAAWSRTLEEALALDPTHLSCYALTIEERTALGHAVRRGVREEPDPDLLNLMEHCTASRLAGAGFERYEISNYSRPGYVCRHNLLYWQAEDYLGLGPSAQSYVSGRRFGILPDLSAYARELAAGRLPLTDEEEVGPVQRAREAVVFGLRLTGGIEATVVRRAGLDRHWRAKLDGLMNDGWLEERGGFLRLTSAGRRLADSVAVELL
jgi:oxygen-independent coproporphyrinogen-3 oxidase